MLAICVLAFFSLVFTQPASFATDGTFAVCEELLLEEDEAKAKALSHVQPTIASNVCDGSRFIQDSPFDEHIDIYKFHCTFLL